MKTDLTEKTEELGDLKHQKMILENILKNEKQEIQNSNDQLNFLHQEIESYKGTSNKILFFPNTVIRYLYCIAYVQNCIRHQISNRTYLLGHKATFKSYARFTIFSLKLFTIMNLYLG